MKKHLQLTSFLLIVIICAACNTSTKVSASSANKTKNIAAFCKVWGFLKYYHPQVSQEYFFSDHVHIDLSRENNIRDFKMIDWDSCFIRSYPQIADALDRQEFNRALRDLLQNIENEKFSDYYQPNTLANYQSNKSKTIDHSWIDNDTLFDGDIIYYLHKVKDKFKPSPSRWVQATYGVGNPDFSMENPFDATTFPTESLRILALARYWNVINYFYPYKYKIGYDWASILEKYIPMLIPAKDNETYFLIMLELCNSINDSHSFTSSTILESYFGKKCIPITVSEVEGIPIITQVPDPSSIDTCDMSLFHKGDQIVKINDEPVEKIQQRLWKYVPGSNDVTKYRNINNKMLSRKNDSFVSIVLNDGKEDRTIRVRPIEYTKNVYFLLGTQGLYRILPGNIGYVNMGRLTRDSVDLVMQCLKKTKAIIFDVRNYPQSTMYAIASMIMSETPFVRFTMPDVTYPGRILEKKSALNCGHQKQYAGKIVILENEQTQSHAEFTVMSLRAASGAKVIGSQTAGADGNISTINLPGGIHTTFTGLGVYYPDWSETQRVGIIPDIEVKPTIQGVRQGKDEVLERAIQYINTGH